MFKQTQSYTNHTQKNPADLYPKTTINLIRSPGILELNQQLSTTLEGILFLSINGKTKGICINKATNQFYYFGNQV